MIRNLTVITAACGGAGKSTVTAGLACAMAQSDLRVAVLDLNPMMGGVDAVLEADCSSPYHLGDAAMERCSLETVLAPCGSAFTDGIHLAAAPGSWADLPTEDRLLQWLSALSGQYDHLLLDVPWQPDCFGAAAEAAATTVIVAETDAYSIRCCDRLRCSTAGRRMTHPRLLLNKFQRQTFWARAEFEDLDQVIDCAGLQLLGVIPTDIGLQQHLPETMFRRRENYLGQGYFFHEDIGAAALHCTAQRLLGKQVPLRNLDRI